MDELWARPSSVLAMTIASHLLHAVAKIAVRVVSPRTAERVVRRAGRALNPLEFEEAQLLASRLRWGSCLTRALTISARLPGSSVVIGVRGGTLAFRAHAWVEHGGRPLRPGDPAGTEIARFA